MKNIENAKEAFDLFKSNYEKFIKEDLSESDTRSKVIDFILIEMMGWDEIDITREGHNDAGYYDYKVSTGSFHFIIEAKKKSKSISITV